jgi:hypothetical protein
VAADAGAGAVHLQWKGRLVFCLLFLHIVRWQR